MQDFPVWGAMADYACAAMSCVILLGGVPPIPWGSGSGEDPPNAIDADPLNLPTNTSGETDPGCGTLMCASENIDATEIAPSPTLVGVGGFVTKMIRYDDVG